MFNLIRNIIPHPPNNTTYSSIRWICGTAREIVEQQNMKESDGDDNNNNNNTKWYYYHNEIWCEILKDTTHEVIWPLSQTMGIGRLTVWMTLIPKKTITGLQQ